MKQGDLGPKQSCLVNDSDAGLEVVSWYASLDAEALLCIGQDSIKLLVQMLVFIFPM